MTQLNSSLGKGYSIFIGSNIAKDCGELISGLNLGKKVVVVTDPTVAKLHLETILTSLESFEVHTQTIPEGEDVKSLKTVEALITRLLGKKFDRSDTIISLGGGVIGDTAGFVAATLLRGVNLIHIPTTLLAQIDSSIGGKTGVNHALGKNLIGTFYQPRLVISDVEALKTLPDAELRNGLAEAVKCGVIEPRILDFLEDNLEKIMEKDSAALETLVSLSAQLKLQIVEADEKEEGERMKLNLGHTIGHAVECASNFKLSHGEAVSIGLVAEMQLSNMPQEAQKRIRNLLEKIGLPTETELDPTAILKSMELDKKRKNGLRMVLPKKLGELQITKAPSQEKIAEALQ